MKSIALIALFVSSISFAVDHAVEMGTYKAIDVETGTIDSTLVIRADGTVNFKVKTPDFEMPAPGCDGKYTVVGDILSANMICPMEGLEKIQVKIDIKNVTPESVRSEPGADVNVTIDALGSDPYKFHLKKVEVK